MNGNTYVAECTLLLITNPAILPMLAILANPFAYDL